MAGDDRRQALTAARAHTSEPPLGVMMAVYNGEAHLRAALDSILAQSFASFELIAIDDGSTDGTDRILADYAARDPRVRVIRNPGNRGLVYTRNRALDACRAPLLAIADSDDLFASDRLQKQVDFLDEHRDIGFVGSNATLIDGNGLPIPGQQHLPLDDVDIRFELLLGGCFWNTSTVYRTSLIRQVGGYREGFDGVEDYDLWSRLLEVTKAANLPERLVSQRLHGNSFTAVLPKVLRRQSTVAQHRLSGYLHRDVGDEEALGALTLFMYGWRMTLSRSPARLGVRVLREVADRADAVEPARIARAFRRRVARCLRQQARVQAGPDRTLAFGLATQSIRWDPTVVASTEYALLVAALAVPTSVIDALRHVKRRLIGGRKA